MYPPFGYAALQKAFNRHLLMASSRKMTEENGGLTDQNPYWRGAEYDSQPQAKTGAHPHGWLRDYKTVPKPSESKQTTSQRTALFLGTKYEEISTSVRNVHALREGNLRELWDNGKDTSLPELKVVIAGDQSSGKSTLMERLTEIPMLRGGRMCTKCPTEIRLRTGTTGALSPTTSPKHSTAPPEYTIKTQVWLKETGVFCDETVFETNVNRLDVAVKIRQAQDYVLSEGGLDGRPLTVSRGLVIVEVHNAPVDLTLVDLPGIVSSHPEGDDVVKEIEKLTVMWMRKPGCIFVVVVDASSDLGLSAAFGLLKRNTPKINDTAVEERDSSVKHLRYAVVTCLDKPKSTEEWASLLCDKDPEHEFIPATHWYAVMSPDLTKGQRVMDLQAAKKAESDFFSGETSVDGPVEQLLQQLRNGQPRERCGIEALRLALSNGLYHLIQSQLSGILEEVKVMRAILSKEDRKLDLEQQAHSVTASDYVQKVLLEAQDHLVACVSSLGRVNTFEPTFHTKAHKVYTTFKENVLKYRPRLEASVTAADGKPLTRIQLAQYPTAANIKASLSYLETGLPMGEGNGENMVLYVATAWAEHLWPPHLKACHESLIEVLQQEAEKCLDEIMPDSYAQLKDGLKASMQDWLKACIQASYEQLDLLTEAEVCSTRHRGLPFTALKEVWQQIGDQAKLPKEGGDNMVEFVQRCLVAFFEVISKRYIDNALLIMRYHLVRNFAVGFERGVYSRLQIKSGGGGNPTVSTIEPLAREIQALIASPTRQKLKRLEDKLADMNIGKATAYLKSHTMEMFVQDGSLKVQRREWVKHAAVVLADVQKVLSGAEVGMSFA